MLTVCEGGGDWRKVVPSASTVQPASRAKAARTSFISARAGRGKSPYCLRPASILLVIARRCRSRSLVLSFSFSLSLLPFPEALGDETAGVLSADAAAAAAAAVAAKPRGRRV